VETLLHAPSAVETVEAGGRVGDEPHRFLEREKVAIAHMLAQQLHRVGEGCQQVEMRAPVRTAEHHTRVTPHFAAALPAGLVVANRGVLEASAKVVGDGDVDEYVERSRRCSSAIDATVRPRYAVLAGANVSTMV